MTASTIGKYNMPVISAAAIKRLRLVSQIQSLSARSILFVHAPVGYGKTTAAVQWLEARNMKSAWFSLDEYDASVSDFYRGLLMAFLNCNAGSGNAELLQGVISGESFDSLPFEHTLEVFTKFNFDNGPQAVVIDDFHLINDPYVALSLPILRSRMPVQVRLVVLSRNPPGNILKDYILKGMIRQISFEELQFTTEEVSKLFSKHGARLTEYDAAKIQNRTMGWPIALSALILSKSENGNLGLYFNRKNDDNVYLRNYIKNQIYDFWDEKTRNILLKTSVCEFITPDICEKLTGQKNAWNTIEHLSVKTGLVMRHGDESYRYQKLLRDFLMSELESDDTIDKNALYRDAGDWHKENGNIADALDMAAKCGDIPLLEDIVRLHSYAYGRFNIGVESYVQEVHSHVLRKLPAEIIESSPRLCLESWFATHAIGCYEESRKWMAAVKKHVSAGDVTRPEDMFMAFSQFAADPEKDPWFIISLLRQMDLKADQLPSSDAPGKIPIPAFTLTYNMPFYHKAQKDYSEVSPALDEYMESLSRYLPCVLSPYHRLLTLLIEGGVRLERYEPAKAKECALRACEMAETSTPELMFASLMLLSAVYWTEGNLSEPLKLWKKADAMIIETNAFYLSPNFSAFGTDMDLCNGNIDSAENWLENNMPSGNHIPSLHKSFQNLVTAKALIVTGNFRYAAELLKGLRRASEVYRRTADFIEAGALLAVCLWRMKNQDEAAKILTDTIITAQKYQLHMPIIKQGIDIVPVLQKIMNRLKGGYNRDGIDKAFVSSLFLGARTIAGYYKGFFAKAVSKPIKLSAKQALILDYLSQNLSHKEMSELSGTKITTIKDHVGKLYQKLGVNNAADALLKAKETGLL